MTKKAGFGNLVKSPNPAFFQNLLSDGRGLAKMPGLHSHSAASPTTIFHGCQFVLAHVYGIDLSFTAKTAFGLVSTGVTQVSGRIGHRAAILTSISHDLPPFIS
jgi:hypothetical protein